MAAFTAIIGAIGLGLSAAGTVMGFMGQKAQAAAQARAYQLQADVEKKRMQQMNLEAMRKKREIVRNSIAARSEALASTTAQGASKGSALPGAYGSIAGQSNTQQLGVQQNWDIGKSIFQLHGQMFDAYSAAASAGTTAATGAGLTSLGSMLMKNNDTMGRVGTYFGSGGAG